MPISYALLEIDYLITLELIFYLKKTTMYNDVINLLSDFNINYDVFHHKPVLTTLEAENILQHLPEEGTKSLVLESSDIIFVVTVAGNERFNFKQIKAILKAKKIRMISVEKLRKTLGLEVGAVPPFGYQSNIKLLFSDTLLNQEFIYINPAKNNITFKIDGNNLTKLIEGLDIAVFKPHKVE